MVKKEIEFIIPENKRESRFIGFNYDEDNSKFFFPCQYQIGEAEKKKEARKILSLIKKAQKDYLYGGKSSELFQFHSMMWLINDFIENGYYVEKEKITKVATAGKINWKKTIKANSVLYASDRIVYKDFARNKTRINDSEIIAQIYKCVLKYSVEKLGFIFGISQVQDSVFSTTESEVSYMVYCLERELSQTFVSYKKLLINHLLSILKCAKDKTQGAGFSLFDKEFEYVFECLVNFTFGTENVKNFYSRATYVFEKETHTASRLRPDTIMRDKDDYYIIDSKYYNYGYTKKAKDLPESSSVTKQIAYNKYNETNLGKKFKSVFLLPYASKDEKALEYVCYAHAQKEATGLSHDQKVAVCLVDLKTLVDVYLSSDTQKAQNLQSELIKLVNDKCFK